ncbi:MAG: hypothetical protein ACTSR3_20180 [Candidatus Helarchaeota archaeon]
MIRAHESTRGEFDSLWNNRLIHIFSTVPYRHIKTANVLKENTDRTLVRLELEGNILANIALPTFI